MYQLQKVYFQIRKIGDDMKIPRFKIGDIIYPIVEGCKWVSENDCCSCVHPQGYYQRHQWYVKEPVKIGSVNIHKCAVEYIHDLFPRSSNKDDKSAEIHSFEDRKKAQFWCDMLNSAKEWQGLHCAIYDCHVGIPAKTTDEVLRLVVHMGGTGRVIADQYICNDKCWNKLHLAKKGDLSKMENVI